MNKKMQTIIAVLIGLGIGGIIIAATGEDPFATYGIMFRGGFGSMYYLAATLTRATPIIFTGLAVCVAWSSGYNTIGMEGQMIFGAFVSAVAALSFPGPAFVKMIAAIITAVIASVGYSLLSAWLYQKFQVTLIISTLMMNYVANYIASYFTTYVAKDKEALDSSAIQTGKIAENVTFFKLSGEFSVHAGFFLAVLMVAAIWFMMKKTRFGYQAKMGGLNPKFALYGGIHAAKMLYLTLGLSGALAGLAGASEVLGAKGRYIDDMISSPGYAWTGIVAALMADFHPVGVLVSSVFLAGLATGGSAVERSTSIPVEVTILIQGIITLFMSAKFIIAFRKKKKAEKAEKGGAAA